MGTTLGLDLGIKTGSLVQITIDEKYNLPIRYRPLVTWTRGPSVKDPIDSIIEWFNKEILPYVNFEFGECIAIDWNQREIYWAANKSHSNLKTFIAGYIMCHCHNRGMYPKFISPQEIRLFFGFKNQKTHKTDVQREFILSVPKLIIDPSKNNYPLSEFEDHEIDALILAYVFDLQLRGTYLLGEII